MDNWTLSHYIFCYDTPGTRWYSRCEYMCVYVSRVDGAMAFPSVFEPYGCSQAQLHVLRRRSAGLFTPSLYCLDVFWKQSATAHELIGCRVGFPQMSDSDKTYAIIAISSFFFTYNSYMFCFYL